jgi:hypothetical protein
VTLADPLSEATVAANVTVFGATQTCIPFHWTFDTFRDAPFSLADIMTKGDFETLSPYCVSQPGMSSTDPNPTLTNNVSSYQLNQTLLVDVSCEPDSLTPDNTARTFISVVFNMPNNVSEVSALLCNQTYALTTREVTTKWGNTTGGEILHVSNEILESQELEYSPPLLTEDILSSVMSYEMDVIPETGINSNAWLQLMNFTMPQESLTSFVNQSLFSDAFQSTFSTVAALMAKADKTAPSNETMTGLISYITSRLVVTTLSLRLMEGLLAVMSLMALSLCFFNFKAVSRSSDSLLHLASALARSPNLARIIPQGPISATQTLTEDLRRYLFYTNPGHAEILVQDESTSEERCYLQQIPTQYTPRHLVWWRPMALTRIYKAAVSLLSLALFVALEVLYKLSAKNNGLLDVTTEGYEKYAWLFIPTLTMSLVGLAFGAMDGATRLLYRFIELRKGRPNNLRLMTTDPTSNMSLVAPIYRSSNSRFRLVSYYYSLDSGELADYCSERAILSFFSSGKLYCLFKGRFVVRHQQRGRNAGDLQSG